MAVPREESGWYFLNPDDIVERGDEYWSNVWESGTPGWKPTRLSIGQIVGMRRVRRREVNVAPNSIIIQGLEENE